MDPIIIAIIWFVITVVFIGLEFASRKYLLPVAMGAGVAGIAALFALPAFGQMIVFVVVTGLAYLLFKPNKTDKDSGGKADTDRMGYDEDLYE